MSFILAPSEKKHNASPLGTKNFCLLRFHHAIVITHHHRHWQGTVHWKGPLSWCEIARQNLKHQNHSTSTLPGAHGRLWLFLRGVAYGCWWVNWGEGGGRKNVAKMIVCWWWKKSCEANQVIHGVFLSHSKISTSQLLRRSSEQQFVYSLKLKLVSSWWFQPL